MTPKKVLQHMDNHRSSEPSFIDSSGTKVSTQRMLGLCLPSHYLTVSRKCDTSERTTGVLRRSFINFAPRGMSTVSTSIRMDSPHRKYSTDLWRTCWKSSRNFESRRKSKVFCSKEHHQFVAQLLSSIVDGVVSPITSGW